VILSWYGAQAVFTLEAAAFLVAALLVLVCGPETKGKVQEEISA